MNFPDIIARILGCLRLICPRLKKTRRLSAKVARAAVHATVEKRDVPRRDSATRAVDLIGAVQKRANLEELDTCCKMHLRL